MRFRLMFGVNTLHSYITLIIHKFYIALFPADILVFCQLHRVATAQKGWKKNKNLPEGRRDGATQPLLTKMNTMFINSVSGSGDDCKNVFIK